MTESTDFLPSKNGDVYCVSSGDYSDYRVLCVCPNKKHAEIVAAAIRGDSDGWRGDARVQALPYVDYAPEKVTLYHKQVQVWDDGTTTDENDRITTEWPFDSWHVLDRVSWRWVRAPMHKNKGGRLEVQGTDLEAVRRVFSDRRAQLLAEDAFRMKREKTGRG